MDCSRRSFWPEQVLLQPVLYRIFFPFFWNVCLVLFFLFNSRRIRPRIVKHYFFDDWGGVLPCFGSNLSTKSFWPTSLHSNVFNGVTVYSMEKWRREKKNFVCVYGYRDGGRVKQNNRMGWNGCVVYSTTVSPIQQANRMPPIDGPLGL